MIVKIDDKSGLQLKLLGGKAFNLQFMAKLGFKIPITYVIPSTNVAEIQSGKGLDTKAVESLPDMLYAIRSSGLSEDSSSHSYAGMFDTFLNIHKSEIAEYVYKCISSLNNKRLLKYEQLVLAEHSQGMCVIIQEMVDADFAGICFTSNPVTNDNKYTLIEFANGLGDKIVSGLITPVTLVFDKETSNLTQIHGNQNGEYDLNAFMPMLTFLVKNSYDLEKVYGFPIDIEWCCKDKEIHFLQARPIIPVKNIIKSNK